MCTSGRGLLFRSIAFACAWLMAATTVITPAIAQTSRAKPRGTKPQQKAAQPQQAKRRRRAAELRQRRHRRGGARDRPVHRPHVRHRPAESRARLSLSTERPVTRQQAYDQLLTALRLQGFTIVSDGQRRARGAGSRRQAAGRCRHHPKGSAPSGDQLVTQVFRLQYESATAMVPMLRPLIAPNNTISAYPQNNTLVITDYADNLRRIQRIIESIDTPATSESRSIPVKNGLALEIATVVNRVLDEGARAAGQASDGGQRVSVLAETRTNSMIIRARSPAAAELAKELIAQLDKPSVTPGNINVIYLRNAEAIRLAPLLRAIIGADASFVPQTGSGGSLSPTTASPGGGLGAASAYRPELGGKSCNGQIPAAVRRRRRRTGGLAGMIQADPATNSLIITAPEVLVSKHPRHRRKTRHAPRAGRDRVVDRRSNGRQGRRVRHSVAGAGRNRQLTAPT